MTITFDFNFFINLYIYAAFFYVSILFCHQVYSSSNYAFCLKNDANNNDFYSQVKEMMQSDLSASENKFIIDAQEFLDDVTYNFMSSSAEHYLLPWPKGIL